MLVYALVDGMMAPLVVIDGGGTIVLNLYEGLERRQVESLVLNTVLWTACRNR